MDETTTRLWLVRHGHPAIDRRTAACTWRLSDAGVARVRAVRDAWALPADVPWWSSPEPKALETARLLRARDVPTIDNLREAERPPVWYRAKAFEQLVAASFAQPQVRAADGWEPADATRKRVVEAVRTLLDPGPAELVLVGHGTPWTLLVSALTGAPPDLDAWRGLAMPDRYLLSVAADRVATVGIVSRVGG